MKTSLRSFTVSEKARLKEEVSWTPGLLIFGLMCAGLVLKLFQFLVSKLADAHPVFQPAIWWLGPWTTFMICLYVSIELGPKGRRRRRGDLLAGKALCYQVDVVEAIEIKEQEDEGPGFFIKTAEGETIFLRGQYLERYVRQKFPWKSFEIVETPKSKYFLGLRKIGEPLKPSFVREPMTWEEAKSFGFGNFKVLDTSFDGLKIKPAKASQPTEKIPVHGRG